MTRTLTIAVAAGCAGWGAVAQDGRWVHPACTSLQVTRHGPFLNMADGSLLTVDAQGLRTSADDGASWSDSTAVSPGVPPKEPAAN